jgi:hypothetical protein
LGDLLLCELELRSKTTVSFGLLNRIEIRSLKVFDESQSEECFVVEVLYDGWDVCPAKAGSSSESSFSGDKLELVANRPYGNGLE